MVGAAATSTDTQHPEVVHGIDVGYNKEISEPVSAKELRQKQRSEYSKGSVLWLDSAAPLPADQLQALLTALNHQWPVIAQDENQHAAPLRHDTTKFDLLFNDAPWMHVGVSTLLSAMPSTTVSSDARLMQRLSALHPAIVAAYAAAGYNVLADGDMSEQWYQQVTASHLRKAWQPHIQLYIGSTESSSTNEAAQPPHHADLVVPDLHDHQRVIDAAREISKTRFANSVGRTCPLCKQLRGALREVSRPQMPADIKGPSHCTYVLLIGADSTYEYQRTLAHILQQRLQQDNAQETDSLFIDMLALHHELHQVCTAVTPTVSNDDDQQDRLRAAFNKVVKQLADQCSMAPAVLSNAIISINDCDNEDELLLCALRSHTVVVVHVDSGSGDDASTWQQVQDWSAAKQVTDSMAIPQAETSAEQAAAAITDKLEELLQSAMKTLDLSVPDTQPADRLSQQLSQLQAVQHAVEDLYLGELAISGDDTTVQELRRLDFLSVLASCPQLKHLHLKIGGYNKALFTGEHLQQCLQHIAHAPQLQMLMVDSWCSGDPGHVGRLDVNYLQHLYDGVAGMRIKALHIYALDLNKTADQFVAMMRHHPTVTQLTLMQCDPSIELVGKLATWLRQPDCKLQHLTIWSAGTGNAGGRLLLSALSENTSLRHLVYHSCGHNSDILATAGTALSSNTTLQHLSLYHDYHMLDMLWDGEGEHPEDRYWKGEIVDRLAFANALEQSNHTLLSCDVFDGLSVRQWIGGEPTQNLFMVARRPEIPQGLEVLKRNQARAGGAYVNRSIILKSQPKSLKY